MFCCFLFKNLTATFSLMITLHTNCSQSVHINICLYCIHHASLLSVTLIIGIRYPERPHKQLKLASVVPFLILNLFAKHTKYGQFVNFFAAM